MAESGCWCPRPTSTGMMSVCPRCGEECAMLIIDNFEDMMQDMSSMGGGGGGGGRSETRLRYEIANEGACPGCSLSFFNSLKAVDDFSNLVRFIGDRRAAVMFFADHPVEW